MKHVSHELIETVRILSDVFKNDSGEDEKILKQQISSRGGFSNLTSEKSS